MKNSLKLTLLAATLGATALAGAAYAFPGGKGGMTPPSFEEMDANGDGVVTADELEALGASQFAALDTDGNGVISAEELTAMMQERAAGRMAKGVERMIEKMDQDGDGALSADEMPGPDMSKMLGHVDSDGDGAISADEFEAAKEQRGERGGTGKRSGHGEGGHGSKGDHGGRG